MRQTIIGNIQEKRLIAIIRGLSAEQAVETARALQRGGVALMEVTFDQSRPESFAQTARAIQAIDQMGVMVGAGTVVSTEQAELAAASGAKYIISPNMDGCVIKKTRELGLVSIPGAMTPTEILQAAEAGADFVKLFPAGNLGTGYVKSLLGGPLKHVKLMAVGGVGLHNMADFLKAGICGFGIGGSLVNRDWVIEKQFEKITELALRYAAAALGKEDA
ncbi:MAG TPA: bifunctional 4-hydroxy-2-oxoglutarate aldolase/2-dehydro-3-deoxy-phosphogluconate aldolase [Feifaniaceae bacterium]|nr:bifunctional 4-hydroxy-2-oxoglutarate aldolase/2-dehydro-3-deoxy-phosphogluconate aldolase [Feifaniaceae bacterium]